MAINIFKNEIKKDNTNTSNKLIESFELMVSYQQNIKSVLDLFNAKKNEIKADDYVCVMDKQTKAFKLLKIDHHLNLQDLLPIMIKDRYEDRQNLLSPTYFINMTYFLQKGQSTDPNIIQNFVHEVEGLKNQLLNVQTNHDNEDDVMINIAVYPTIKDYIIDTMGFDTKIIDDTHINKEDITNIIKNIFNLAVLSNVKTIKEKTKDSPNITTLKDLDKEQKIGYPYSEFYCITEPITNKEAK